MRGRKSVEKGLDWAAQKISKTSSGRPDRQKPSTSSAEPKISDRKSANDYSEQPDLGKYKSNETGSALTSELLTESVVNADQLLRCFLLLFFVLRAPRYRRKMCVWRGLHFFCDVCLSVTICMCASGMKLNPAKKSMMFRQMQFFL